MDLETLKKVMKERSFWPKKRLGQNFLVDESIAQRMSRSFGEGKGPFMEIGGGFGSLTEALVTPHRGLYVLEPDPRLYQYLLERFWGKEGIVIEKKDFLKVNFFEYCRDPNEKFRIIGNLPYAITSPILLHLVDQRDFIQEALVTVQKEVAQRLTAKPKTKAYGSLSCFIQCFTSCETLFQISRNAFYPRPKVDSTVVLLRFLERASVSPKNLEWMIRVIRTGFGKRRKILANALTDLGKEYTKERLFAALSALGFSKNARAEELNLEEFAHLSDKLIG
ncbi:MAG: ribosomal RNA small subunit methyltransferase A [Candidatus Omnitrophica bacterium]|nr:ribosomal RNA small subunit methyltransferase A [Candidatus Omnitrophota bacterium]